MVEAKRVAGRLDQPLAHQLVERLVDRGAPATSARTCSRANSLPSTAAASSTARSSGASRSRRAASSAWIVGGSATSAQRPRPPSSAASRRAPRRTAGCPRRPRGCGCGRRRRSAPRPRGGAAARPRRRRQRVAAGRSGVARQAGRVVEELRARGAENEQRRVPDGLGQVVEQVEQRRVGPLEVVDGEHERLPPREPLDHDAQRPDASSGATGSPVGSSSSTARGIAGCSSPSSSASSPLAPSASASGHHVRPRRRAGSGRWPPSPRRQNVSASSATSRDLPTPGAPTTVHSSAGALAARPLEGLEQRAGARRSRSTIGARGALRPRRRASAATASSRKASTRRLALDRQRRDRARRRPRARRARRCRAPSRISPGGRGLLEPRRDVDDVAGREEPPSRAAPVAASPVLTPIRTANSTPRSRAAPPQRRGLRRASRAPRARRAARRPRG